MSSSDYRGHVFDSSTCALELWTFIFAGTAQSLCSRSKSQLSVISCIILWSHCLLVPGVDIRQVSSVMAALPWFARNVRVFTSDAERLQSNDLYRHSSVSSCCIHKLNIMSHQRLACWRRRATWAMTTWIEYITLRCFFVRRAKHVAFVALGA